MSFHQQFSGERDLQRAVHRSLRQASCATGEYSPHLWDGPELGESRRSVRERHDKAVEICESCPVRQLCADWAYALADTTGVWGGEVFIDPSKRPYDSRLTVSERQLQARRRLRARIKGDRGVPSAWSDAGGTPGAQSKAG